MIQPRESQRSFQRRSDVRLPSAQGFAHLRILTVADCVGSPGAEVIQGVVTSYRTSRSTRVRATAFRAHRRMTRMDETSAAPRKRGQKSLRRIAGLPGRLGKLAAADIERVHIRHRRIQWITKMVLWTGRATVEDGAKSPRRTPRTVTYANRIALGFNARSAPQRYVRNATTRVRNAYATNLRSVTTTISSRS